VRLWCCSRRGGVEPVQPSARSALLAALAGIPATRWTFLVLTLLLAAVLLFSRPAQGVHERR